MEEIVTYTDNELEGLSVVVDSDTVWLTQAQMAELFAKGRSTITEHIQHIFEEGELQERVVCRNFRHTTQHGAMAGKTQEIVAKYYNLDVIISVGYRVKSLRGTQFRQWATQVLREHLLKGYTLRQPVTLEHLQEMKRNLEYQIQDLRKKIEQLDVVTDVQYSELYKALIELTSQKQLQESERRRIGFAD
ncbi:hypothetical protein FACS189456_1750 [Bacteroidia bacterium]|nr:hypothetical protein FACS189456_1750 [Bacteroidia bacterium]